jgi:hypothetical protein
LVATREIAAVLREIRELFAVPWDERDKRWEVRRAVTEARKSALVAECEAISAARSRQQDRRSAPLAHGPAAPAPLAGEER